MEYMCYNQTGEFSTLEGTPLKLVDKFTYLGSSVASTKKDIDTRLTKAWTAINRLSIIWKSDLTDKIKRSFFQAAVASILLYGCTTWTLTKRLEKKLDGNYTRMLRAIWNKSWRQHPTRHQLYGHLPPITKTIQVRRTRHAGHCWRSRDELISDVLLWTPTYGRAKAGRPARTYIQQLCGDTGCNPEDLPEAMNDREKWRERVRDIRATSTTWWWWWWLILEYFCADCMPPVIIKHKDQCLIRVLVLVHLSTMYRQNKTFKTSFGLGDQLLHLGSNDTRKFLCCFCSVFVILKLGLVGWGCRIHQLHLCTHIISVLNMILNYLNARFQECWIFEECTLPLYCHWLWVVATDRVLSINPIKVLDI